MATTPQVQWRRARSALCGGSLPSLTTRPSVCTLTVRLGHGTFVWTEVRGIGLVAFVCDASSCKEVAGWGSTPTLVQTNSLEPTLLAVFTYNSPLPSGTRGSSLVRLSWHGSLHGVLSRHWSVSEISPLWWISAITAQYLRQTDSKVIGDACTGMLLSTRVYLHERWLDKFSMPLCTARSASC